MRARLLIAAGLLVACGTAPQPTALLLVTQPPSVGTVLSSQSVPMTATIEALSVVNGAVAVGTEQDGVLVATGPGSTTFNPPTSLTGAVSAMTLNQDGTLLVAAIRGLFVSSGSTLSLSPMSALIRAGTTITSLSSFGSGSGEQLWFVAGGRLQLVSNGALRTVSISGLGSPDVVVAMAQNQAVVVAGGKLQSIDLNANALLTLVGGLGHGYAASRDGSGTAWIGVDAGLVSFDTSGDATLRTLAPSGVASVAVCGLFASASGVYAGTPTALLDVTASGVESVGTLSVPTGSCPLAVDGQGNIYVSDASGLRQFAAPTPPPSISYAMQVKPIFDSDCMPCHGTGTNGAPIIDFDDYATAKEYGQSVVGQIAPPSGSPLMPPSGYGYLPLSAQDTRTIVDWVNGAEAP